MYKIACLSNLILHQSAEPVKIDTKSHHKLETAHLLIARILEPYSALNGCSNIFPLLCSTIFCLTHLQPPHYSLAANTWATKCLPTNDRDSGLVKYPFRSCSNQLEHIDKGLSEKNVAQIVIAHYVFIKKALTASMCTQIHVRVLTSTD